MNQLILSAILCVSTTLCLAQTQSEMNQTAYENFKKADKELNTVYQNILKDYNADTTFIKNFKAAQKLWIQFRDAEMKTKYPDRGDNYYGSVQPMCCSIYVEVLTEERINNLKVWLAGIEEGDVCAGSVKRKN